VITPHTRQGDWLTPGGLSLESSSYEDPPEAQVNPHLRAETDGDYVALGAVVYQSLKRAIVGAPVAGALTVAEVTLADSCLDSLTARELRDLLRGFTWAVRADLERARA
jgi:hypothetical protein